MTDNAKSLYVRRRRLAADYRTLTAEADYHGNTWSLEQRLDALAAAINDLEALIDAYEESTSAALNGT